MGIALFQKLLPIAASPSRGGVRRAQEAQPPAVNEGGAGDAPKKPLVLSMLKATAPWTEQADRQQLGLDPYPPCRGECQ